MSFKSAVNSAVRHGKGVATMLENIKTKEFSVLGIGEVMLRLSPVGKERVSQSETFEKMAGGSELNVVAGISQLGLRTGIVTVIPNNEIGKFIKNKIRYSGISDDYIIYDSSPEKRLGIYYYESGAYPRVPVVTYDRAMSSFARFNIDSLNTDVYDSTNVFHLSGITLALGENVRKSVIRMLREFKRRGVYVSFDVNYRASLWDEDTARETILSILPMIDILFVSEETLRRMFARKGELRDIHKALAEEFPGLKMIASTMRQVVSPTKHTFTSLVYDCEKKTHFSEEPYTDIEVIDRIGSGDAYVAGALFGALKYSSAEEACRFGNAMAAVKNTIPGDMTVCDFDDITRVIRSHSSVGYKSEMVR